MPSTAPNPTIIAKLPRVPPKPALSDEITSSRDILLRIPTTIAEMSSAITLFSLNFIFNTNSKATPTATQIIGK
ncbi:hypothetical protein D3C77_769430 [compost metagenome]